MNSKEKDDAIKELQRQMAFTMKSIRVKEVRKTQFGNMVAEGTLYDFYQQRRQDLATASAGPRPDSPGTGETPDRNGTPGPPAQPEPDPLEEAAAKQRLDALREELRRGGAERG